MVTDKHILVIGDSAVAEALIQVMDMLASYSFVYLDPGTFPNSAELIGHLAGLKDEDQIQGIILTEPDGIELAKHIRLSDSLGRINLMPLIVISPSPIKQLVAEKADNIFLLSRECYLSNVSDCIPNLLGFIETAEGFITSEEMKKAVRPFVIWSEEDDVVSSHDNFNRYGPFRLMQEHFSGLPEFMSSQYGDISSRLWFKKYRFLESNTIVADKLTIDEDLFRKTIANKKVLYIDDEHRLGWSFALYSLFSGNSDQSHYQIFQDNASVISTSDSRFTSIDNVQDALKVMETYQDTLIGALTEYSDAEHLRNRLAEQAYDAKKSTHEMEVRFKNSETNFSRSETSLRETEARLKDINTKLKKASDDFLEAYTNSTGDIEIPDILPQIKEVSDIHALFAQEGVAFNKHREEFKRNKDIFEKQKNELDRHKSLLEESETNNSAAIKKYDEAVRALSQGRMFPYDLVILDLRLERFLDKDRAPNEISGVKALKRIKEIDPSIPVLMFTASEKVMNYQQAKDLGASGYWIKAVNDLSALKSEIIYSLEKAQEARNLWLGIRKVEAKQQLSYIRENAGHLEKGTMGDAKKAEILLLLKESFLLFMKDSSPYEQSVHAYTHYGKIVLNMGMIQEERFSRLQDKRWDFWVNQKAREIDQEEITIRQLRNRAAHKAGSRITCQEVLGVFQKTIERCLKA